MELKLIDFETAKLLKDKGFKLPDSTDYIDMYDFTDKGICNIRIEDQSMHHVAIIVTQELVKKWLREEHKILIAILPWKDHQDDVNDPIRFRPMIHRVKTYEEYDTYEDALEKALIEALKLIKT